MQNSKRVKSSPRSPLQSYKINSLRSKLAHHPHLLTEFEQFLSFYAAIIDTHSQSLNSSEHLLRTVANNVKAALNSPWKWLEGVQGKGGKEREGNGMPEGKIYQFEEMFNAIAANSIIIEVLGQIKAKERGQIDLQKMPIGEKRLQLVGFYQQLSDYYHSRICINRLKGKMSIQEIIKNNSFIGKCDKMKIEIQEMTRNEENIDKIGRNFLQIEQQLLGFKLAGDKPRQVQDIQAKLQKLLVYIKESSIFKENEKATPKSVKECNQIIQLLTLLGNSNVGLMQDKVKELQNKRMKETFTKVLQNIIKKQKIAQEIYDFLMQNINEKVRIRYLRSVKNLSLEKKLGECEKVIRQMRRSSSVLTHNPEISSKQSPAEITNSNHAKEQEIQAIRLESDQKLLMAQEVIYSLEKSNEQLRNKNQQMNNTMHQKQSLFQLQKDSLKKISQETKGILQEKQEMFQAQKKTFRKLIIRLQAEYEEVKARNTSIEKNLLQRQANQEIMAKKLQQKQQQIIQTTAQIQQLIAQLTSLANIKPTTSHSSSQTSNNYHIHSNIFSFTIEPMLSQSKNMGQDFNFIQDIPLNLANPHIDSSPVQSPTASPTPRKRMMKHSRSLSNVDFYSQLMPDTIEKEYQDNILQGTFQSEQLKKGIQMRQKTIKKYEIFMDKQRKQAKRHRSQILQLQSKIRSLQLQQIRLTQLLDDQTSEKYLHHIDEQEQPTSMVNISDSCEKIEQIGSIEKIAEKQVQLKVKEEKLNFKIEEIIQHVLKLNTFKAIRNSPESACNDEEYTNSGEFSQEGRQLHETQ